MCIICTVELFRNCCFREKSPRKLSSGETSQLQKGEHRFQSRFVPGGADIADRAVSRASFFLLARESLVHETDHRAGLASAGDHAADVPCNDHFLLMQYRCPRCLQRSLAHVKISLISLRSLRTCGDPFGPARLPLDPITARSYLCFLCCFHGVICVHYPLNDGHVICEKGWMREEIRGKWDEGVQDGQERPDVVDP